MATQQSASSKNTLTRKKGTPLALVAGTALKLHAADATAIPGTVDVPMRGTNERAHVPAPAVHGAGHAPTIGEDNRCSLAKSLGVSAKPIHRLFVKETGFTFAQWREQMRLLSALRRLAQGERVIDVAFDCGYLSQSAFMAVFKRRFGITPSEFYR